MNIKKAYAKSISYSGSRDLKSVKAIVIHNTGNDNDTARNNALFFRDTNERKAGAHYFIDQKGEIYQSIKMGKNANAVGGAKYPDCNSTGGGRFYGTYNNQNTVSIELCDIVSRDPSDKMIKSLKSLITHIRKYCPNAKTVIRHFDVNGKDCPERFISTKKWNSLLDKLGETSSKISTGKSTGAKSKTPFVVRVLVNDLKIRKGPGTQYEATGALNKGDAYTIIDTSKDGWGKLKYDLGWIKITDRYVKRV